MNDSEKHFDRDSELRVSSKLSEDLDALFKSDLSVPPEVDRAIMDRASQHLIRRRRKARVLRWLSSAAAAAAIVLFVFLLDTPMQPSPVPLSSAFIVAKTDIDQNGSVDILDAFQLARHIKSAEEPDVKWDINGDGLVNRKDVDTVASAAVRLDKGGLL